MSLRVGVCRIILGISVGAFGVPATYAHSALGNCKELVRQLSLSTSSPAEKLNGIAWIKAEILKVGEESREQLQKFVAKVEANPLSIVKVLDSRSPRGGNPASEILYQWGYQNEPPTDGVLHFNQAPLEEVVMGPPPSAQNQVLRSDLTWNANIKKFFGGAFVSGMVVGLITLPYTLVTLNVYGLEGLSHETTRLSAGSFGFGLLSLIAWMRLHANERFIKGRIWWHSLNKNPNVPKPTEPLKQIVVLKPEDRVRSVFQKGPLRELANAESTFANFWQSETQGDAPDEPKFGFFDGEAAKATSQNWPAEWAPKKSAEFEGLVFVSKTPGREATRLALIVLPED